MENADNEKPLGIDVSVGARKAKRLPYPEPVQLGGDLDQSSVPGKLTSVDFEAARVRGVSFAGRRFKHFTSLGSTFARCNFGGCRFAWTHLSAQVVCRRPSTESAASTARN